VLPVAFYGARDAFRALPIPPHFKPAIGGLGIGLLALFLPQVLSGGYGWIQEAMDGKLATQLLFALLFAKIVAFSLTVSSGGSGGVFAPSLFVGAMLGGSLAQMIGLPPAGFVIVGMAAVFGGAARVPIATLLMVAEMTGGYSLLVPASLAVVVSYLVQSGLSSRLRGTRLDYSSLYEAQVDRRRDSPAHRAEHVQIAMQLLRDAKVPDGATLGHLDLVTLLRSGIPIDLPNHEQLCIGVVRDDSACVGQPICSNGLVNALDTAEFVGVLRGGEMLLAHSDQPLKAGDQVLLICPAGAWSQLGEHLTNVTEATDDGR
jgi:CIC family chloride channel protein